MNKFANPLYTDEEWTPALLSQFLEICEEIGTKECGLDLYPNEVKIATPRQMEDTMVTGALPLMPNHWHYGLQSYRAQGSSAAFLEVIQNTNPCHVYCTENNTATEMLTVLAHAAIGHNAFFKSNFVFQSYTNPNGIVDYLLYARHFLKRCEEKYGEDRVADVMAACMALAPYSVDLAHKPKPRSYEDELARLRRRVEAFEAQFNPVFQSRTRSQSGADDAIIMRIPERPDENILKVLEKNGPKMRVIEEWQSEIVRIFRKINEFFYPISRTIVVNEGVACTMQWKIFQRLSPLELGAVTNRAMNNFFDTHGSVIAQHGHRWRDKFDGKIYLPRINHYSLGFQIFQDIERMCKDPTPEDRAWFPSLPGRDFWEVFREIIAEHDNETFINTFLSPKVIRDYAFFVWKNDPEKDYFEVTDIHNEEGYVAIREKLARMFTPRENTPDLSVAEINVASGGTMLLRHVQNSIGVKLDGTSVYEVLTMVHKQLWPRPIVLESVNNEGKTTDIWTADGENFGHETP